MFKICNTCNKKLPRTGEYFNKDKRNKDGLFGQCRKCRREYSKQYRENHKERRREYNKQYYGVNKERLRECGKQWRKDNPGKNKSRRYEQKRRALKAELPSILTDIQWNDTLTYFDNRCAYCGMDETTHLEKHGERLHQEHIIALSNGGGYTQENTIPSCKSCNSSKNASDLFEWYSTYKYYSKEREDRILEHLERHGALVIDQVRTV